MNRVKTDYCLSKQQIKLLAAELDFYLAVHFCTFIDTFWLFQISHEAHRILK
ncbi:MAG: hypothetical protein HRU04_21070 [Oceanospirillaceae bacterium]|nr:hypothetical protein [Oceanospirillaceae bacterium]